ncbi:hypothetical protein [Saccharopolyspora spinosa]|uniref:hypothetical protein n=1 Tax=Saccharopolyspora spinosa TaxID=60894 RepID=UPI0002F57AFE|nr:hypothetical protein [Saccharopolyspora spinosa]
MRNLSEEPVHALQLSAPGGWDCFVEDLIEAQVSAAGRLDLTRLNTIAAKYRMTYEQ